MEHHKGIHEYFTYLQVICLIYLDDVSQGQGSVS